MSGRVTRMMLDIITDCLMRMRYRACSRFTGNPGELLAHIHVGTSGLARWSSGFLTSNSTLGRMRLPVKSFCLLTVSLLLAACAQRTRQPIPARVPAAFSGDSPSRNTSTDSTREYTASGRQDSRPRCSSTQWRWLWPSWRRGLRAVRDSRAGSEAAWRAELRHSAIAPATNWEHIRLSFQRFN